MPTQTYSGTHKLPCASTLPDTPDITSPDPTFHLKAVDLEKKAYPEKFCGLRDDMIVIQFNSLCAL